MFAAQVAELSKRYRCVTFDFRGQGKTPVTPSGYGMDDLTNDAIALIEGLGLGRVHFAGLSMGGFVAMRLGARRPDLVRSLILLETSAGPEDPAKVGKYKLLGFVGRWLGFGLVANQVMPIMFGRTYLNDPTRKAERDGWRARLIANDRIGIVRALGGVTDRAAIEGELAKITVPTLVIVGDEDVATVPAKAEAIRDGIPGAKLVVIPRAGHSSTIEEPQAVNAAISAFLADVASHAPAVANTDG
jgi:pimeloyl-ACP methyl ester carboxylesterase